MSLVHDGGGGVVSPEPVVGAHLASPAVIIRPWLLLEPVRLARTGPADPVDRIGWPLRDSWDDHLTRVGDRPRGGEWLADVLDAESLSGHGGGHFPTGRKWHAALRSGLPVTVVANAAESEPLSAKDETLIRQRPHLVLDGLILAAEALDADRVVFWIHHDEPVTRLIVLDAIEERRLSGLVEPPIEVVAGPPGYLSGESSAIAHALSGGPALPLFRGFGQHARGGADRMTVVHNVETLARVALLARESNGSSRPGPQGEVPAAGRTALITVLTPRARHVLEVDSQTTVSAAVEETSWPDTDLPAAVLLGGFGGTWMRWEDVASVSLNEHSLKAAGASLGAGIIAPLGGHACGVAETAAIVAYLAASSARQCGPCLFGLDSLASRLDKLRAGKARRSILKAIAEDLMLVRGRGACHHPDGTTRLVASALDTFAEEVASHAKGRPCANAGRQVIPVPEIRR